MDKSLLKRKVGFVLITNTVVFVGFHLFGFLFFARYFMVLVSCTIFLMISIYSVVCDSRNRVYNKNFRKLSFIFLIALVVVLLFPSTECRTTSKSTTYLTRCNCIGIEKPTGWFSYGCLGVRTACYKYSGGVDMEVSCKSWINTWSSVVKNLVGKKEPRVTF